MSDPNWKHPVLPTSPFWKKKENAPYPWVLAAMGCVFGGWLIGLGVVGVALLAGPDGIAEVW